MFHSTNLSINLLNCRTNLFITKFDLENEGISTHTNASYLLMSNNLFHIYIHFA